MLLQAAVHWKRAWGERLRVIVAGDGPLRNRLYRLRTQLGLENAVLFAGNLSQRELALRYNAADVTVLTSHSEGTPNVLLESLACGTPFVATDVGGVSEIMTSGMDRLVPAGDATALAAAVGQFMQTAPSGHRGFVPTDLDGMADQIDAVIARTAAGTPSPTPRAAVGMHLQPHNLTFEHASQESTRR